MTTSYWGIDPGLKGYIAIDSDEGREFHPFAGLDALSLADLFYDLAARHPRRICAIEDVRAIHGTSSTSTFSFGFNKGLLIGMLCATRTPFEPVLPKTWQKSIWTPSDIVKKDGKVDTKATSAAAARRLAPEVDFRRTEKCRMVDDNKCDAFLLSQYAKRNL